MFHGFPAEPVTDTNFEKNMDIGLQINRMGHQVYLIHYEGLGKNRSGTFTFSSSLDEAVEILKNVLESNESVILLGHSWGGYLALILNILFPERIKKTVTLSPFCFLPESSKLEALLNELCKQVPYVLKEGQTSHDLTLDLLNIDQHFFSNKQEKLAQIKNFSILHAIEDDEIPLESSKAIREINPKINLIECDTNHSFLKNRNQQIEKILEVISEKNNPEV